MVTRNRGLSFALSREDNTPEFDPDDQGPIDVVVDPDHPETIQHLSLPEYYHLVMMHEQSIPYTDGPMVQEGFSETMANFKSFFQRSIGKEESYIDTLWERYKQLAPRIQAVTDKPAHSTPISLFGDYAGWFEAGGKLIQTPQQIFAEVNRIVELNTAIEKYFLPSFSAEIKYAMDCLSLGATDIDGAYKKIYVINKVVDPMKGFESILQVTGSVKLGSGKTVPSKESHPYMGSLILQAYQLGDSAGLNIDRGHEMLTDLSPKWQRTEKVQLRQGSRDELKNIVQAATKALEIANSYLDKMLHAEANMLADKVNSFENSHRNWRQYPQEERRKIVTIMHAGDTTINRVNVVHDVLFLTRKALRSVERYVETSLQRFA